MECVQQRVLVVDDYPDAAKTLAFLIESRGHEVATAMSGREALKRARDFQPTIIVLDIGLPDMDGYEVARCMRNVVDGEIPWLIALTGRGNDEDQQRAMAAGFDHHLIKPVEFAALDKLLAVGPRASR